MFCSIRTCPQTCVFPFRTLSISPERGAVPLSSPGKSGSCRVPGGCASYSDNSAPKWSCSFRIFRGEATRPSDSWLLQTAEGRGRGAELGLARTALAQLMVLISLSYLTHVGFIRGLSWASRAPERGTMGPNDQRCRTDAKPQTSHQLRASCRRKL